jgi:hypothetical protein
MFAAGAHKGCSATPVSLVMELTRGRSTGLDMGSWAELPHSDHRCGWRPRLLDVAAAELTSVIVASVSWMRHSGNCERRDREFLPAAIREPENSRGTAFMRRDLCENTHEIPAHDFLSVVLTEAS